MDIEVIGNFMIGVSLVFLGITITFCLYRAVKGPRLTDTVLGVNVVSVKTTSMICLLSVLLKETYLVDIALVYAILGFLAVVVLSKMITKAHDENNKEGVGE